MSRGRAWHRDWRGLVWADAVCWRDGFSLLFGLGSGWARLWVRFAGSHVVSPLVGGGCELDSGFG